MDKVKTKYGEFTACNDASDLRKKYRCPVEYHLNGNIKSLYLKDMQDPATGKIPPRGVNIHQDKVNMIFEYIMHYITPKDYEAAKKYVPDPETYDFKKILNW